MSWWGSHEVKYFLQDKQRDLYKLLEDADVHLDFCFEALTFNFESLEGKISNQCQVFPNI